MEFIQYLLLCNLLVAVFGNPTVNGYVYSFGSLSRNPRTSPKTYRRRGYSSNGEFDNFSSSPRNNGGRSRRKEVNQAFRELQEELEGMNVDITSGYYDSFPKVVSEMVDKDTAKKWIDKTFDLASELNKDFATIPGEKETNNKNLRKTRDLLVSVFDGLYNDDQDNTEVTDKDAKKPSSKDDSSVNFDGDADPKTPMKSVSETPNWENRSNDNTFSVAIDLPGVNRADVEISVQDDDILILRAKRDTSGGDGSRSVRIYAAKIALPEANQIDVDKLEATMKNGVLVITAPKHKPSVKRRTIPIS